MPWFNLTPGTAVKPQAKANINQYGNWDVFYEYPGDTEIVIRQESTNRFVISYEDGTDRQCMSVAGALSIINH